MRPRFLPSARTTNWLLVVGFVALGAALWMRYLVIQNTQVGLACDAGRDSTLCLARLIASRLFGAGVFGWVAVGAAAVNLLRPTVVTFAIALAATAIGVVLYNAGLAGFGGALLLLSLARPAPAEA